MVVLSACSTESNELIFGEGDWDSHAFHNQVAKFMIEEGYDTTVNVVASDTSIMVSGLKSRNIDVSLEIWSDNIVTYDEDLLNNEYEQLAVNFDDNKQGLYIPAYLQVQHPGLITVQDLKDYAHLFPDPDGSGKGIIYGGPEGWSATEFLQRKMVAYDLESTYIFKTIDSGATLSATLASAYRDESPWVGYNWEPTWVMGLYDLVLLEDTEYSADAYAIGEGSFPSVDVTVAVRNGLDDDFPLVYEFLKNYETSTEITNAALAYMQENSKEADEAAIWFLLNYEDLWKTWVPEDVYQKILDALE
jgi:glycine betaine/proline transport system substrate-binding protein